jgi:predicted ribosome quality control (RQC) complex YloA/Tae2 family protein
LIVELYDRGNILLTDYEYTIISVLRPRTDQDSDVKFTVREKYPLHLAKQDERITKEKLKEILLTAKPNDDIKRLLTTHLTFGASLVE